MATYTLTEKIGIVLIIIGIVAGLGYAVLYPNRANAPQHIVSPPPQPSITRNTMNLRGTVVEGGVECLRLRAADGAYYTIVSDLPEFSSVAVGDTLDIEGAIAEVSHCQQDTTIEIRAFDRIEPSPSSIYSIDTFDTVNWKTYRNEQYGFLMKYPPSMEKIAGKKRSILGFIPLCDERDALCLYYPTQERFGKTNFEGAAFAIFVRGTTKQSCESFSNVGVVPKGTRSINDVRFFYGTSGGAATGHTQTALVYQAFHDAMCYTISLPIDTYRYDPADAYDEAGKQLYKEFIAADKQAVMDELEMILSTFKFIK